MATKTYRGSCHCGAVTFEADIDLAKGTGKCNCRMCWKSRRWASIVAPSAFRSLTGRDQLTDYGPKVGDVHNAFCKVCGMRPYAWGHIPEVGGDFVSVNLACLDDLDPGELAEAPVRHADGRHDNWMNEPAETRHL